MKKPKKPQARKVAYDSDYKLPCDVHLGPATTIRKGCKLSTLMAAFKVREDGRTVDQIEAQARELGDKFRKDGP